MREFRKKQAKMKKIMNALIIFSAVVLFIYIGAKPIVAENLGSMVNLICSYFCDALVIACMIVLFCYFSKYSKSDKFLERIEYELSDAGYYFTAREEDNIIDYINAVVDDLRKSGFAVDEKVEVDDFEFSARGMRKNEFFYAVSEDTIDKNDVIAYLDSAIYDVTAVNIKRKGNGVVLFVAENVDEDAISLSKMITPIGNKEQIKFAVAIVDVSEKKCYFLGNKPTKCQQMIANYAMNCEVPLKAQYIGQERLKCQDDLEEHMKSFNIKDYKDGTFYAH